MVEHAGSAAEFSARSRVLVVDDDASLAEMLTIVLRQEGFDGRVVTRGDLALEASTTTGRTSCCWT